MRNQAFFLAARVVCGAFALTLLPLTAATSAMLLQGPGPSARHGVLLILFGGGPSLLVRLAVLAPRRLAAALPGRLSGREDLVRKAIVVLAVFALVLPFLSLGRRAL